VGELGDGQTTTVSRHGEIKTPAARGICRQLSRQDACGPTVDVAVRYVDPRRVQ
jgi:hypothetical protein